MQNYDVTIIGGGITGTGIARELSKYNISVLLLESRMDIGSASTKGNGGIVHAGYDPKPGSIKGKVNVKGSLMYPKLAKELGFEYKNTGSFVVGFNDDDLIYLKKLLANGQSNGVPNLEIIGLDQMLKIQPNINPNAKYALYAPSAGVVDPFQVAIAFAENAVENGVDLYRNQKVIDIKNENHLFTIKTQANTYQSKYIVNAAGVYADKIANLVGIYDYTIKPRLGEILVLDKSIGFKLNVPIFPIPSAHTKGIVVIPTVSGNIVVGSTARMTEDKNDVSTTSQGVHQLLDGASRIVPEINAKKVIRTFAGLRPVALNNNDDFIIEASKTIKGFISVAGIQSPGVASAPAIAEYVRDILSNEGLVLKEKADFNPYRKPILDFSELSDNEKDKLIKEDSKYGHIVCRCECVTEGEIVSAIKRPVGATTIEGVKRRTRAGMGRCQSGFCQHKVLSILSRELGISKERVLLENEGSNIVFDKLKA